ncbi:MAG: hypothetical protein KGJ80_05700 [Chloroflexota bacterium]|nr:hypothetical protein [Chloroflexota bacterium]
MSTRPPVDRKRIEQFLQRLGERFRKPARVFLVGGTTMVFEGFRAQSLDIDLTFEVVPADHGEMIQTIRDLKDQLGFNVEEVSPGDFIPLAAGYRERAVFIARYGQIDAYHFDLYATALSKVARGTEEDLNDVLALLRAQRIDLVRLETYFEEIRPRVSTESLNQDVSQFDRNFQAMRRLWKAENSSHRGTHDTDSSL